MKKRTIIGAIAIMLITGNAALVIKSCKEDKPQPQRTDNTYTGEKIIIRTPVGHLPEGEYTYALFPTEIFINGHHHPVLRTGDTIGVRISKDTYAELTPDTPSDTKYITNTGKEIEP